MQKNNAQLISCFVYNMTKETKSVQGAIDVFLQSRK